MEIHINEVTERRLAKISKELGRSVEDLARTSVEEAALRYFSSRDDDPKEERRDV